VLLKIIIVASGVEKDVQADKYIINGLLVTPHPFESQFTPAIGSYKC